MSKDLSKNFELPKKSQIAKTNTPSDTLKKPSINENSIRVTLDMPEDLHTDIKLHIVKTRQTIKQFLIEAAKQSLSGINHIQS